jgi:large subunit ribosomal protein L4
MATPTYTKSGTKATTAAKLDKRVFAADIKNHDLLKQAYLTYQANGRSNNATTLTRGNVRGGGKKPWKQKGTGRARFGSIRVPIWRGGGITFGPLGNENYSKKLPTTMKRVAIRQALTVKANAGAIIVVEDIAIKDDKTAAAASLLHKIGADRRVLIAVANKTPELERAFRNIPKVIVSQAMYLNVYDILNADKIVITSEAIELINAWLGSVKEAASSVAKAKEGTK